MKASSSLERVDEKSFGKIWGMFIEFGNFERHFNELQSCYRSLASTWLPASFAGIGFLITKEPITIPIDPLLAIGGIGLATSIGIVLLWNLDLMVYQKLLHSAFIEGIKLEDEYRWLPSIRKNMMRATNRS